MTEYCPRAAENGGGPNSPFNSPFNGEMTWRNDNTCSYCGSLHPDELMRRIEAGDVTITPTDKSYKIYVENAGGDQFKQTYRQCPPDAPRHGPDECEHWVTRETDGAKFYFQHLSSEQRTRFIEIYNEKKMKLAHPGYFYVMPFFCTRA